HTLQHAPHPAGAFTARRALAAALVLEEVADAGDRLHDIGGLVHDRHASGAQRRAMLAHGVEVHQGDFGLFARDDRAGRAAWNDGLQVFPAAAHAAAVILDQLAQRDRHGLFDHAGRVHVTRQRHQLGAGVVRAAEAGEPVRAATQDGADHGDRLDVVHGRRAAIEAGARRERRLQTRLALLAFKRLQQGRLFAADISARAVVDVDVEVPAMDVVVADQPGLIGLLDGGFHALALEDVFAAQVD